MLHRFTYTEMAVFLWALAVVLVLLGEGLALVGRRYRAGQLRSAGLSCLVGAGLFYLA